MDKCMNSDMTLPTVKFMNCLDLEVMIKDWLGSDNRTNEYMGLLLIKLGLLSDSNDNALVYNYNKKDYSFNCIINGMDFYNIRFRNLNLKGFNTEIEVRKGNVKCIYECIPIDSIELGMRILKKSYGIYENKICFTRTLSMNNVIFNIDYEKYILEFGVVKPNDINLSLFDNMGNYSKYSLDNEDNLVDYLKKIKFPISIVDVYKDICRISLGDISIYPRILLKVYKRDRKLNKRVIDLIHLSNGNLLEFGMTVKDSNRTLFLNEDDSWSYEMVENDSNVLISTVDNNYKINYNISVSNRYSLDDVKKLIETNIDYMNEDMKNVKVLVKRIFNKIDNEYE